MERLRRNEATAPSPRSSSNSAGRARTRDKLPLDVSDRCAIERLALAIATSGIMSDSWPSLQELLPTCKIHENARINGENQKLERKNRSTEARFHV